MQNKSISWILDFTAKLEDEDEQIKCLRANQNVLKDVLKYTFDPKIKWLLPEGIPPYKPSAEQYNEDAFYHEVRKLYLFVEGGNMNLTQSRREFLFVEMLQHIHPEDAELLCAIKDRKLPYDIDAKLVLKAFPGLF